MAAQKLGLWCVSCLVGRGIRSFFPQTPHGRSPLPGGIYASPTNKATAYTNPKTLPYGKRPRAAYMRPLRTDRKRQANGQGRCLPQSASGGRERPPYKPGETVVFPGNPARQNTPAGRHICLPYKHPVPRTRTQKRCHEATAHRPHFRPNFSWFTRSVYFGAGFPLRRGVLHRGNCGKPGGNGAKLPQAGGRRRWKTPVHKNRRARGPAVAVIPG